MAPTTTIRVGTITRDELKKMANSLDDSYDTIIRRLIASQKARDEMTNKDERKLTDEEQRLMMLGLEVDLNNRLKENPTLENEMRVSIKSTLEKINGNIPLSMRENEFGEFIRALRFRNATMAIILDQCHQMGRISFTTKI